MTLTPIEDNQTLSTLWNSRREESIPVKISYQKLRQNGCDIFTIRKVEELD
jgi:hypothetical protein